MGMSELKNINRELLKVRLCLFTDVTSGHPGNQHSNNRKVLIRCLISGL